MTPEKVRELFEALWTVAPHTEPDVPKLLAHYTSLDAMEKILRTEEIWFSNPLLMNDNEEVRFGVLEGVRLVDGNRQLAEALGTPARTDQFADAFEHYFEQFETKHVADTYVLCFCKHQPSDNDGALTMWRGYGGNDCGAAMVIDPAKFGEIDGSAFVLGAVHYASQNERREWLRELLNKFIAILRANPIPDDVLSVAAYYLFERIKLFALFSKHHGFSDEREWRVVYLRDRDHENKLVPMLGYHIGPKGVEPKLKFKVAPISGHTPEELSLSGVLDRLLLGPSMSSAVLAKTAFLRLLDEVEKPDLKDRVFVSSIPFRPD